MRKLAALEALSRYGKAQGRMVGSITIAPNQWPTSAVIDWLNILKRVQDVPQRAAATSTRPHNVLKRACATRAPRWSSAPSSEDYWWWLMTNGDVNTARLLLTVMDDPAWKDDIGKLVNGFIGASSTARGTPPPPTCGAGWRWRSFSKRLRERGGDRHHRAPTWARRQDGGAATGTQASSASTGAAWSAPRRDPAGAIGFGARPAGPAAQQHLFLPWPARPPRQGNACS